MKFEPKELRCRLQVLREGRGTDEQLLKLAKLAGEYCWNPNLDCPVLTSDECAFRDSSLTYKCLQIKADNWLPLLEQDIAEWRRNKVQQ